MARSVPDARRDLARLRDPLRRVLLEELVADRPKRVWLKDLVRIIEIFAKGQGKPVPYNHCGSLEKNKGVTGHFPWVA